MVEVNVFILNLTGQPRIEPGPATIRRMQTYVARAKSCGLSDEELTRDVAGFWPSARREITVRTDTAGEVWVDITPRCRERQRD